MQQILLMLMRSKVTRMVRQLKISRMLLIIKQNKGVTVKQIAANNCMKKMKMKKNNIQYVYLVYQYIQKIKYNSVV